MDRRPSLLRLVPVTKSDAWTFYPDLTDLPVLAKPSIVRVDDVDNMLV
jgi:hypothetical protein